MNETGPDVSVVIPNFNHGALVGSAIESVLDQIPVPREIVVVDDGSTDNSREVLNGFRNRIRIICQDNRGLGAARNAGITAAAGEWIGFLDADDQWRPGFLREMAALVRSFPKADVFYCCAQGMDSEGCDLPQVFGGPVEGRFIYWTLLRTSFIIPSTVIVRRSVLLREGMFETGNRAIHGCEDWDLWLRLAPKYQFVGVSARLVRYRLHADTFSANRARMRRAVQAVIEKNFGPESGCRQNWPPEKRRAYGGVCRFRTISLVQQDDWSAAAVQFRKALEFDPTLALDRDFFYDLALGSQPSGHRGSPRFLDLEKNAHCLRNLLEEAFYPPCGPELETARHMANGTANLAFGLVAYNSGSLAASRRYLLRACRFQPLLCFDPLVMGDLGKSLMGQVVLKRLRKAKRASHA